MAAADDPLPIPPLSPYIFSDDLTSLDDLLSFDLDDLNFTFNDHQNQPNPSDLVSSDPQFNSFVPDFEFDNTPSPDVSGRGFVDETVNPVANLSDLPSELRIEDLASSNGSGNGGFAGLEGAMTCPSPDSVTELRNEDPVSSRGSGNGGSTGSEGAMMCPSPDSGNSVVNNIKLKRKNESCGVDPESRTIKNRRSNEASTTTENSDLVDEEDEKKKARLIRNRESAQLSRERKKHYVEELEDKVKAMQATIHDLNARISYFAAENATLKQQMVAGGAGAGLPPVTYPYPPHPAMAPVGYGYPWMPCPPYVVKPPGSQVPLVPIPRLKPKPQQKPKKDVKKTEGTSKTKTKKVASVSFIGLLLFIVLFGALVPLMNVKFGGVSVTDGSYPVKVNDYKLYNQQHHGKVLIGDEHKHEHGHGHGHVNGTSHNASEPLVASLYVPRNNKLVKIDGSLIISSVLASEKAMASRAQQVDDTSLVPAIPIPSVKYRTSSDHHQRALPSNKENLQSQHGDGKMQQWFREGFSGLMLSSGMCTEVFQFDASVTSSSGAIVPATGNRHNSTYLTTVKNRRILHGLPIPLSNSTTNITKEQVAGRDSKHEDDHKNRPVSSMVVSVLVDPREAGDGSDLDGGMMGGGKGKSFSRIFVVVLLDSVKYVTYSCMLPLKGTSHLA